MPESLVCLAPTHVCLQTDAGYLPKSRKFRIFFFAGTFCIYRLFLSPDRLMNFVHLELATVAKANIMYSLS